MSVEQAPHYDTSGYLKVNVAAGGAGGGHMDGTVAHDGVDADYPVKIGGKALTADPTAVASADRVNALFDKIGRMVVARCLPENQVSGVSANMTNTTPASVIAAQGAGVKIYVTSVIVANEHASVDTSILLQDGSGGTTLARIPAAHLYGGAVVNFDPPLATTANTALCAVNTINASSTYVTANGYKGV